jgi:hypothetical protein
MLAAFEFLREFDALSREPFVVFLEPPAVDRRILNQLALFSLMSDPAAVFDDWLREHRMEPKLSAAECGRLPAGRRPEAAAAGVDVNGVHRSSGLPRLRPA